MPGANLLRCLERARVDGGRGKPRPYKDRKLTSGMAEAVP